MKVWSGHIVFRKKFRWIELEDVFPEILKAYMEETKIYDEMLYKMSLRLNMIDIKNNRKPEGYNRDVKMKMIFPLKSKMHPNPEFYIYRGSPSEEIYKLTNRISKILKDAGINHTVKWNNLLIVEMRRRK